MEQIVHSHSKFRYQSALLLNFSPVRYLTLLESDYPLSIPYLFLSQCAYAYINAMPFHTPL